MVRGGAGTKQGQLACYSGNSLAVQDGVANRYVSELTDALEALENEKNY